MNETPISADSTVFPDPISVKPTATEPPTVEPSPVNHSFSATKTINDTQQQPIVELKF